jgi:integrase
MRDMQRPRSFFPIENHSDGLLLGTARSKPEASSPFRRRRNEVGTGPLALTLGEVKLVLDSVPNVSHGRNAANRNGALIRLLLWGMLRKEELVEATWECVDGETLWITGKGGKRRAIPIADSSTWSYLHAYTNELSIPSGQRFHGPLLRQLDHEDRPITRHVVEHLLDALWEYFVAEAARRVRSNDSLGGHALKSLANKLHSHIFRATGATFMAKAGMNLIMLALLLGHSDPSTTMRYYIEAKQLVLTEEVLRVCRAIEASLETAVPSTSPHAMPNPRSWYERRGLIQG